MYLARSLLKNSVGLSPHLVGDAKVVPHLLDRKFLKNPTTRILVGGMIPILSIGGGWHWHLFCAGEKDPKSRQMTPRTPQKNRYEWNRARKNPPGRPTNIQNIDGCNCVFFLISIRSSLNPSPNALIFYPTNHHDSLMNGNEWNLVLN